MVSRCFAHLVIYDATTSHDLNPNILNGHKCIKLTTEQHHTIVCATMCSDPNSLLWTNLHEEIRRDSQLQVGNIKCLFFEHDVDRNNTLCVTIPGLQVDEQLVDGAPITGICMLN